MIRMVRRQEGTFPEDAPQARQVEEVKMEKQGSPLLVVSQAAFHGIGGCRGCLATLIDAPPVVPMADLNVFLRMLHGKSSFESTWVRFGRYSITVRRALHEFFLNFLRRPQHFDEKIPLYRLDNLEENVIQTAESSQKINGNSCRNVLALF